MTKEIKMTMTKEESDTLNVELDQLRTNVIDFKSNLHELAYRSLVHYHNCGNVCYIQKLYDILAEDKLLRKSAFAKWVLMYAPLIFSDESKKFTKNKNPNSMKFLYMDDKEKGAILLAGAYGVRFWDVAGGEESVNPTTWDVFSLSLERMLKRAKKEIEAGNLDADELKTMNGITETFDSIVKVVSPLTTKALEEELKKSTDVKKPTSEMKVA